MSKKLVQEIHRGSIDAWHSFVEDYSGLIFTLIRRYLVRESEDEWRTLYVDVLQSLYRGKLRQYDGRSALSTWVAVITRSRCLDYLRSKYGRREVPRWVRGFSDREQQAFRLYYQEGLDYQTIRQRLGKRHKPLPFADLAEILSRLEAGFDRGARRRVAYDLYARSIGATSGRRLEYLDNLREELAARARAESPETKLLQRETRTGIRRLRGLLSKLPQQEREVLDRRYYQNQSARRIAAELGLAGQRRAYTLIEKGLRRLRVLFEQTLDPPKPKTGEAP